LGRDYLESVSEQTVADEEVGEAGEVMLALLDQEENAVRCCGL
jgi:hypothetical protein